MLILSQDSAVANIAADLNSGVVLAAQVVCNQAADNMTLIKSALGHLQPVQWQGNNSLRAGQLSLLIGFGDALSQNYTELFDLYSVGIIFQSQDNIVHWCLVVKSGDAAAISGGA